MRLIDAMAYRKVLDEEMDSLLENTKNSIKYRLGIEVAIADLGDMPTIDAVPVKRGTWKLNKDGSGTCDQCHFTQKAVWDYDGWQNFCGVCGADMREREGGDA